MCFISEDEAKLNDLYPVRSMAEWTGPIRS